MTDGWKKFETNLPSGYEQRLRPLMHRQAEKNSATRTWRFFKLAPVFASALVLAIGYSFWRMVPEEPQKVAVSIPKAEKSQPKPALQNTRPLETEMLRYARVIEVHEILVDLDVLIKWTPQRFSFKFFPSAHADSGQVIGDQRFQEEEKRDSMSYIKEPETRTTLLRKFKRLPQKRQRVIIQKYSNWKKLTTPIKKRAIQNYAEWQKLGESNQRRIRRKHAQWKKLSPAKKNEIRKKYRG